MFFAFLIIAAIITVGGVGVVTCRNPVYSALWLIVNLLGVACMFALLDAHFLAVAQIIVYAGAIMVLFLFVVMLLNLKRELPMGGGNNLLRFFSWVLGLGFAAVLARIFLRVFENTPQAPQGAAAALSAQAEGTTKAIGKVLYTDYLFTFEAASLLIIVAILGAVMLAKRRYRGKEPLLPPVRSV